MPTPPCAGCLKKSIFQSAAEVGSRMRGIKRLVLRSPAVRRCSSRRPDAPRARPRRAGHRGPSSGPTRPRTGRRRHGQPKHHHKPTSLSRLINTPIGFVNHVISRKRQRHLQTVPISKQLWCAPPCSAQEPPGCAAACSRGSRTCRVPAGSLSYARTSLCAPLRLSGCLVTQRDTQPRCPTEHKRGCAVARVVVAGQSREADDSATAAR